ncbi:MAG: hypothetical protein V2B18_21235 [Pseudomonadota bacterium]
MPGQSVQNPGYKTFTAGEDMVAHRRVGIKSGTTTWPPEVEYVDAGVQAIGMTMSDVDSGDPVAIRFMSDNGTFLGVAADSFALDATLYAANNGMISDSSSGTAIGKALEAAGALNDIVEWIPFPVISTTAAAVSVADAGEYTAKTTVEAAIQEIYEDLLTIYGTVPIPLGAITAEDGTALTKQATTVAGFQQIGNKELVIDIPINDNPATVLAFNTPMPRDLDDTADITVNVLVSKAADLDTLTLDCEVFPCAAGDLQNTDIQDTAAQAIVAAGTVLQFTCGADGVPATPCTITGVLTLGGTNDGDAVYIHGVWIEYKKKLVGVA